jgi:hypothetical protein
MPSLRRAPQELVQTPPWTLRVHFAQSAASSQKLDEPMEARVLRTRFQSNQLVSLSWH